MLLIKWLSHLPLFLLYRISDFFYFLVYYVIGYRKKVVAENIKIAFPEKSVQEIKLIQKKFYKHFCDLIFEFFAVRTMSKEELMRRIEVDDQYIEMLRKYFDKGQSIILVVGHQGNWEWLLQRACITYDIPFDAVYQKLSSKKIDDFTIEVRSRFGGQPVEMRNTYKEIINRKDKARGFCMVADQSPREHRCDYFVDFFNIQTPFYTGMASIAEMTDYPVVFAETKKVKRGYYKVDVKILSEPPYEKDDKSVVDRFAKALEDQIRNQPELWLWSHRRWKYAKV